MLDCLVPLGHQVLLDHLDRQDHLVHLVLLDHLDH